MPLTRNRILELEQLCNRFRIQLIEQLHAIQTGHTGGSLSCCEILTMLYLEKMQVSPNDPEMPQRDRLVLSKGHAAPMLYLCLAEKGFFPAEEFKTLRQIGSRLQGHPCAHKTPGVDTSSGPLGLGLSVGLGISLAGRLNGYDYDTYVLMGDGEIQEGCIWEAAMSAAKFKANRLIGVLDHNKVQLDGTNEEIMPLGDVAAKWTSFGWKVIACAGHDLVSLSEALDEAKAYQDGPVIIIAETVKGKGVSFMEGKSAWHGKPISDEDYTRAIAELGGAQI